MSRQGTDLSRLETSASALAGVDKLFVVSNGPGIADPKETSLRQRAASSVRHIKIRGG